MCAGAGPALTRRWGWESAARRSAARQLAESPTSKDFETCFQNESLPVKGQAERLAAVLEREGPDDGEGC